MKLPEEARSMTAPATTPPQTAEELVARLRGLHAELPGVQREQTTAEVVPPDVAPEGPFNADDWTSAAARRSTTTHKTSSTRSRRSTGGASPS